MPFNLYIKKEDIQEWHEKIVLATEKSVMYISTIRALNRELNSAELRIEETKRLITTYTDYDEDKIKKHIYSIMGIELN